MRITRESGFVPRYHEGRNLLQSSDFPCRGGMVTIRRRIPSRPWRVSRIAWFRVRRCFAVSQRPLLVPKAKVAGLFATRSRSTRSRFWEDTHGDEEGLNALLAGFQGKVDIRGVFQSR